MPARRSLLVLTLSLSLASVASAADPKFEFGKEEEVKAPEWKVSAQLGLLFTTGNSRSLTFSGGANASYKHVKNRFSAELTGALVRNEIRIGIDRNMDGDIDPGEIDRETAEAARNLLAKLRYDRFFGERSSVYATARGGFDEPAGKEFFAAGQVGYSRLLYKTEAHELAVEGGYDLGYEDYLADSAGSLTIHSLRLFAGYTGKLSADTGLNASVEGYANLNEETVPQGKASPFEDLRGIAKTEVTTKLGQRVSLRVALKALFDNVPAPLPPFGMIPYQMGFVPLADKVDFVTELALIVNVL
jgi:hypothetical protein